MRLAFTKMQGTGNDFVIIDCTELTLAEPAALARRLCDRRFGVGADQMLLVLPSPTPDADFRMAIYNADGSEVEMCGNGVRCFARYVRGHGLTAKEEIRVHTDAGIIRPTLLGDGTVRVDMGEPILEGERIPSTFSGPVTSQPLTVQEQPFAVTCVSMGNPHCVVFVDDVASFPVVALGPDFERHAAFPRRINTEFIEVVDPRNLRMRVWERGSGETMACGTGASAALVAAVLNDKAERTANVHLAGGVLAIEWDAASNHVYMTGPAEEVFSGVIDIKTVTF
jgi:diaminopimelate epimerase